MTILPADQRTSVRLVSHSCLPDKDRLSCEIANLDGIENTPEAVMAYVARVSNPGNQNSSEYAKLLAYCIKSRHWSVFETSYCTMEVETTMSIAKQVLRHRSCTFQELSRRYADGEVAPIEVVMPNPRAPHPKNRQDSIDTLSQENKEEGLKLFEDCYAKCLEVYDFVTKNLGWASEIARDILPMGTKTKLYITGNCRTWMHYISLRGGNGTQKEHQEIVDLARPIFAEVFPYCYEAASSLEWNL